MAGQLVWVKGSDGELVQCEIVQCRTCYRTIYEQVEVKALQGFPFGERNIALRSFDELIFGSPTRSNVITEMRQAAGLDAYKYDI